MSDILVRRHWLTVGSAAARLAAFYAAGLLTLGVPLVLFLGGLVVGDALKRLSLIGAVAFVAGFAALAVARRVGFGILWLVLFLWWVAITLNIPPFLIPVPFLSWSVFALPLYLLTAIGLPVGRRPALELTITLTVWIAVIVLAAWQPALHVSGLDRSLASYFGAPNQFAHYLCFVLPYWIVVREVVRVAQSVRATRGVAAA